MKSSATSPQRLARNRAARLRGRAVLSVLPPTAWPTPCQAARREVRAVRAASPNGRRRYTREVLTSERSSWEAAEARRSRPRCGWALVGPANGASVPAARIRRAPSARTGRVAPAAWRTRRRPMGGLCRHGRGSRRGAGRRGRTGAGRGADELVARILTRDPRRRRRAGAPAAVARPPQSAGRRYLRSRLR